MVVPRATRLQYLVVRPLKFVVGTSKFWLQIYGCPLDNCIIIFGLRSGNFFGCAGIKDNQISNADQD